MTGHHAMAVMMAHRVDAWPSRRPPGRGHRRARTGDRRWAGDPDAWCRVLLVAGRGCCPATNGTSLARTAGLSGAARGVPRPSGGSRPSTPPADYAPATPSTSATRQGRVPGEWSGVLEGRARRRVAVGAVAEMWPPMAPWRRRQTGRWDPPATGRPMGRDGRLGTPTNRCTIPRRCRPRCGPIAVGRERIDRGSAGGHPRRCLRMGSVPARCCDGAGPGASARPLTNSLKEACERTPRLVGRRLPAQAQ